MNEYRKFLDELVKELKSFEGANIIELDELGNEIVDEIIREIKE